MKTPEQYEHEINLLNSRIKELEDDLLNPVLMGPGGNHSMFNWNFNNLIQSAAGLEFGFIGDSKDLSPKDKQLSKKALGEIIAKTVEELSIRVCSRTGFIIDKLTFEYSNNESTVELELR